jgi:hypothetical protein
MNPSWPSSLHSPDVVPPVVVYQSAVREGERVFTTGQLPMKDVQLMTPGKLGGVESATRTRHIG